MGDDIPYLLLTPGPLATSRTVRLAMRKDLSTWDTDYNERVQFVRSELVRLATTEVEVRPISGTAAGYGTECDALFTSPLTTTFGSPSRRRPRRPITRDQPTNLSGERRI